MLRPLLFHCLYHWGLFFKICHLNSLCVLLTLLLFPVAEGAAQCQGGRRELHAGADGAGGVRAGCSPLQEPGGSALGVRAVPAWCQQLCGESSRDRLELKDVGKAGLCVARVQKNALLQCVSWGFFFEWSFAECENRVRVLGYVFWP